MFTGTTQIDISLSLLFAIFYSGFSISHCKAYLWQQILARGTTRSTQIPAHHDGDVASTRLARVVETVLLSTDLDILGPWISAFLKFKLNHVFFIGDQTLLVFG